MATTTVNWATEAAITCTLTSLADAAYRQSAVVDNTTNKYLGARVGGSVQVGTSPTDGGTIEVYYYSQWGGTGDYDANASGSDAAYTADGNEKQLKHLTSIGVDGTSDQDYTWSEELPVRWLPPRWGLVFLNKTGATLNATGTNNEIQYQGVKEDTA